MSLQSKDEYLIPEETRRVARAAFPKGTLCLRIADVLGTIYRDQQFAELFARRGQPAASPARLALARCSSLSTGCLIAKPPRRSGAGLIGNMLWPWS